MFPRADSSAPIEVGGYSSAVKTTKKAWVVPVLTELVPADESGYTGEPGSDGADLGPAAFSPFGS